MTQRELIGFRLKLPQSYEDDPFYGFTPLYVTQCLSPLQTASSTSGRGTDFLRRI
jgi:hypothetical protein